jgi:FK506-binding protein 1
MGVEKKIITPGNGQDFPKKGEVVAMHYTGCLFDANAENNMGTK